MYVKNAGIVKHRDIYDFIGKSQLQGDCITCLDKLLKCEVDCLMPNFSEGESFAWPYNTPATQEQVTDCTSLCAKQYDLCEDTDEAVACLAVSFLLSPHSPTSEKSLFLFLSVRNCMRDHV